MADVPQARFRSLDGAGVAASPDVSELLAAIEVVEESRDEHAAMAIQRRTGRQR